MSNDTAEPNPHLKSMVFITTGKAIPADVIWELSKDSDRGAAIVGSAIVEDQLGANLQDFLHHAPTMADRFLFNNGPVATFSAKIDLGLLVGFYSAAVHAELTTIRKIRNKFAHSLEVKGFGDQQISDWAKNLTLGEIHSADTADTSRKPSSSIWFAVSGRDKAIATPRGRFLLSVQALLQIFAGNRPRQMPKPKY